MQVEIDVLKMQLNNGNLKIYWKCNDMQSLYVLLKLPLEFRGLSGYCTCVIWISEN
jgi:hypothetical protein